MTTITPCEARARGLAPITRPYGPDERELLARAIADLAGVAFAIVEAGGGLEVWRVAEEITNARRRAEAARRSPATKNPRHPARAMSLADQSRSAHE